METGQVDNCDGQIWAKRYCVLEKNVFRVFEKPGSPKCDVEIPLGSSTIEAADNDTFKLCFDSKVFIFHCRGGDYTEDWIKSIELAGATNVTKHDALGDSAPQMSVQSWVPSDRLEDLKYTYGQEEQEEIQPVKKPVTKELVPQEHSLRRCCGNLFVQTDKISRKWRRTFCVFTNGKLYEFAYPGDKNPIFIWMLKPSSGCSLYKVEDRLEVKIQGELARLVESWGVSEYKKAGKDFVANIKFHAQDPEHTYEWALSMPDLLQEKGQDRVDSLLPCDLAKQCAKFVSSPIDRTGPLAMFCARAAAAALSFYAKGSVIRKQRLQVKIPYRIVVSSVLAKYQFNPNCIGGFCCVLERVNVENGAARHHDRAHLVSENCYYAEEICVYQKNPRNYAIYGFAYEPGEYVLHIEFKKFPIFGSPFRVSVPAKLGGSNE
uniref:PH domain-containing protein n=1 Tax=Mucochytrium quahogii TaxID=96639 RepID=A0A7S2SMB5_9STRA|mmetsp:Transcript_7746/g.14300  ORF Transcript_7746/g.14300 Transcript_7746/m.14300 type:complete len:433 (+) Transcript_7746:1067-2365(+)